MALITLHANGAASAESAWERYADPSRWPDWAPQIRSVHTGATRIARGVDGLVVGPFGVRAHFVVDAVDESRRTWSWTVAVGPLRIHLRHRVTRRGAGTATSLQLNGPAPVILGYAPIAQLALRRLTA